MDTGGVSRDGASFDSTPLAPGTRMGAYEIVAPLAAGGMGQVYLARDPRLNRKVALKVLPPAFAANPTRVWRFEQEARAASGLNHPNILTIHEVGQHEGRHFLVSELVEGQTLRERIRGPRLATREVLDIGVQVAAALVAAHGEGIVHRDIKPENLMVRPDGLVKVLDFGLAKLSHLADGTDDTIDISAADRRTTPGAVLGTTRYMSPEQARGFDVDGRSDIFSLGLVLYEMVLGRPAFGGETASDALVAVLTQNPAPLTEVLTGVPPELSRIVGKALQKDREARYQTAADVLADLEGLRRLCESHGDAAAMSAGAVSSARDEPQGRSQPRQHAAFGKMSLRTLLLAAAGVVIVVAATMGWRLTRPTAPILTDKDTILLADFDNQTGEDVFDGTLRQGLAVQLQQSPFLALFPDARVRSVLQLMGQSPDERLTRERAAEICQRQGLKAFIAGSIARFDRNYSITLEAVGAQTGESIALIQVEAEGKDRVLRALSSAASDMREKLGESLNSVQAFDASLEATTSSLEALKALSLGYQHAVRGQYSESIPLYKRAVELDPNFAYAYASLSTQYYNSGQPGLAAENAHKAFLLRDSVTELEQLRIASFYYIFVTGERDQAIEVLQLYRRSYPRDFRAVANLAASLSTVGRFEEAAEMARERLLANTGSSAVVFTLGQIYTYLGRFDEAKAVFKTAMSQQIDATEHHELLYAIAIAQGDDEAARMEREWVRGKADEDIVIDAEAAAAGASGRWARSQDLTREAVRGAVARKAEELAARYMLERALRASALGQCGGIERVVSDALAMARNQHTLWRAPLTLAWCERWPSAQTLVEEVASRYPKDTLFKNLWLPTIRAAHALRLGKFAEAITELEGTGRYEAVAGFWPQFVRGHAYLSLRDGASAAREFQKVLDHRGQGALSTLYPLSQLGLARASLMTGDSERARAAYDQFFSRWTGADADLPILVAARREAGAAQTSLRAQ